MAATAFNPLATAHELEAAGIERRQAEAIAEGMRLAAGADRADLATKADLAEHRAATKADLAALETSLRAELAEHRTATKAELDALRTETKAELAEHRTATKADLAAVRADLYREIGALRSEMRWMFGFQAAIILAMAAKLFGIV